LISAGATREFLDPVRFLSNESTGYMGTRLAAEALTRGHRVTVVHGPVNERFPRGARTIPVVSAADMARLMRAHARTADAVIMAAAVADFRPSRISSAKLPRRGRLTLKLAATPDIVSSLPRRRGRVMAGFALETRQTLPRGARKLREKRLDVLVAQQAGPRSPFGRRKVRAWLLEPGGNVTDLGWTAKPAVARALLDKIESLWETTTNPSSA
jgi:phosphopantothenoylcysteine decarboxylase/phosphopantothenate--cysteine ligase